VPHTERNSRVWRHLLLYSVLARHREVQGSRWASRSSKPLRGRSRGRGWVRLPCTSATAFVNEIAPPRFRGPHSSPLSGPRSAGCTAIPTAMGPASLKCSRTRPNARGMPLPSALHGQQSEALLPVGRLPDRIPWLAAIRSRSNSVPNSLATSVERVCFQISPRLYYRAGPRGRPEVATWEFCGSSSSSLLSWCTAAPGG
jgi:hypothetical protein